MAGPHKEATQSAPPADQLSENKIGTCRLPQHTANEQWGTFIASKENLFGVDEAPYVFVKRCRFIYITIFLCVRVSFADTDKKEDW